MSKNPLSGFAPKQTIESSALAAYPHSATYLPLLPLSFILNKLQHNLTSKKKTKQEHLQEVTTEITKF